MYGGAIAQILTNICWYLTKVRAIEIAPLTSTVELRQGFAHQELPSGCIARRRSRDEKWVGTQILGLSDRSRMEPGRGWRNISDVVPSFSVPQIEELRFRE